MTGDDDGERLTFWRALRASEFWLLFVAALGAGFGVTGWTVIPLCMAGLMLSSYGRRTKEQRDIAPWIMGLSSLITATGASVSLGQGGAVISHHGWG